MVRCVAMLVCAAGVCGVSVAQRLQAPTARPAVAGVEGSVGAAMRSLASRAGLVFVGQVVGVERKGGVVEVVFRVDQVMQGSAGGTYTLREWAGLLSAGQQRYVLGQRAMLFLRAPNAAGMSSPVDGMEGVVPVVPMGADAVPLLDVRRLATRVQRAVGEPMRGEAMTLTDAVAAIAGGEQPALRSPPSGWVPRPVRVPVIQAGGSEVAR